MAGISSKAAGGIQNKYKFNGGNELQSAEFSDGSGLETYDAVNRMYDPQLGRFFQPDELAESNWEMSPYNFASDNPINFNDPLGLADADPKDDPTGNLRKEKTLSEVVVKSVKKMSHNQMQSLYWILRDAGNGFGGVKSDALRARLERWDGIQRHMDKVHAMTRAFDKVVLEVASNFIPVGWITKLRYLKYAAKLFRWKRGGAVTGKVVVEAGDNVVYHSVEEGVTQYVGITNNLARREAEHLASKGINIEPLMQGLTRADARAVEQALIEVHGLGKNGGTLLNKINSIVKSNPSYASQLARGYELLKSIGY